MPLVTWLEGELAAMFLPWPRRGMPALGNPNLSMKTDHPNTTELRPIEVMNIGSLPPGIQAAVVAFNEHICQLRKLETDRAAHNIPASLAKHIDRRIKRLLPDTLEMQRELERAVSPWTLANL